MTLAVQSAETRTLAALAPHLSSLKSVHDFTTELMNLRHDRLVELQRRLEKLDRQTETVTYLESKNAQRLLQQHKQVQSSADELEDELDNWLPALDELLTFMQAQVAAQH
ncbi:hypothetical protein MF271_10585 [Deinococcus sp. KNUC1210]|uniref:hypothetical protein n=1 Tax=Deinococcus sp. KNUC1210 TaxID=2917691 RepID=UPI001EEF8DCD|nr:hypothetical protein [Deinococcus sp. KNUC1210]ULH14480.1 hypothetical protein MF271_10585 [Deinococcus sp. KNUC1210]